MRNQPWLDEPTWPKVPTKGFVSSRYPLIRASQYLWQKVLENATQFLESWAFSTAGIYRIYVTGDFCEVVLSSWNTNAWV